MTTKVEFELHHVDSGIIYIPKEATCLFPFDLNFQVKSNAAPDQLTVKGNPAKPTQNKPHIHLKNTNWFKTN